MSLTTGRGPLSPQSGRALQRAGARWVAYVEPFGRRVRGVTGDRALVDSERTLLVHRPGEPPAYAFPVADVHGVAVEHDPDAPGHVRVAWNAVEAWYEEDERVFGHPRNPYHRVDCVRTSRRLRVEVAGAVLVDTTDTVGVYETALEPKLYVRRDQVRMELLRARRRPTAPTRARRRTGPPSSTASRSPTSPGPTTTRCPSPPDLRPAQLRPGARHRRPRPAAGWPGLSPRRGPGEGNIRSRTQQ